MKMKTRRERFFEYAAIAGLIWAGSHFILNFLNSRYGLFAGDGYHNGAVYGLMIVYVLSLFLFDALLWFIRSREANRLVKRYWAICSVLMVIWFVYRQQLMASESGGSILAIIIIWLTTPFSPMAPLSELLFFKKFGMEWDMVMDWHSNMVLFLCTIHFFYFSWLFYRCEKRK